MPNRIKLKDIKIKKEYHNLVPRMKKDDDLAFDQSIKDNGVREPLTLNQNLILLDGHSRYAKAKKYRCEFVPYKIKSFDDPLLEKKYVIECNLERRHLTNYQKVELGVTLLKVEQELAKRRKKQGLKQFKNKEQEPEEKGKSVEIVAKKVGLSSTTMMRGKVVMEKAPEHLKERLRNGKVSINSIYNAITRKERNLPKANLPSGSWSVVMVDLPIKFNDEGIRGSSSNNYETMSLQDCKLGIINGKDVRDLFSNDCIIFAWFQASTIFYARDILESWGFDPITNMVWDKDTSRTGTWLDNRHEHLVIARRGTIPIPAERIQSIIKARPETRIHSKKPIVFYQLIEKMYPLRKYLDLFSRYKYNENWTCFGDQFKEVEEKRENVKDVDIQTLPSKLNV